MALTAGTKLGPYEILSPLGAGGMGEVYRANDTRLGRTVAVKVLPTHLWSNPDRRQRLQREAKAISALNHRNICHLYDIGSQEDCDFLVMEYLEGVSLAERIQRGPMSLKEVLKLGIEVCDALDAAHRAGVIHRDLKPSNIMLAKSGAKLMDFGLAKLAGARAAAAPSDAPLLSAARTTSEASPISPLTTAGAVIGTIQYMSPEQIEGKEADARSDLFALGAVLYEALSGKRPFAGKSQISMASAILEQDPEPISTVRPLTPLEFERVVRTCLAKDPDERFQSARDVRLELKWIFEAAPGSTPQLVTKAKRPASRWLPWTIAVLAILVAAGTVFVFPRQRPFPRYTRVTYRDGALLGARFAHDGQTIVYSGQWEGTPSQVSIARVGSPESRPLGIASAEVASVSSSDEVAIMLGCEQLFEMLCGGTLATVDLAGGAPRTMQEHVAQADWHPDGKRLAIIVATPEGTRLEFPPGHVLYEKRAGWFGHPRFSPDGSRIAIEYHPFLGDDTGEVDLVALNGKEVWVATELNGGWADAIVAVTPSGKSRTILTSPSVRLFDIAKDGRVLLSRETFGRDTRGLFPSDKTEHPYSWLDSTNPTAISDDGKLISFYEGGDAYALENDFLSYYRLTDGSPAVRIGTGRAAVSPDGKWLVTGSRNGVLQLLPIGAGKGRTLPTPGITVTLTHGWSQDGKHIVYEGETAQHEWNVYIQSVKGELPTLLKRGGHNSYPTLSPDGSVVALHEMSGGISLYRIGEQPPTPLKGAEESEYPIRFIEGGRSLLVGKSTGDELALTRIDIGTGKRRPWKSFHSTGLVDQLMVATPNLEYYAYPSGRGASILYIVDNLH